MLRSLRCSSTFWARPAPRDATVRSAVDRLGHLQARRAHPGHSAPSRATGAAQGAAGRRSGCGDRLAFLPSPETLTVCETDRPSTACRSPRTLPADEDAGFVSHDPGFVSRRHDGKVPWAELHLSAIIHNDRHLSRDEVPHMGHSATVGLGDGLDVSTTANRAGRWPGRRLRPQD
jgi:hypothetical protein